jgi:hypothetical protein
MPKNKKKSSSTKEKKAGAAATSIAPPENFAKVVKDMCNDLSTTFPEYAQSWSMWCLDDVPQEEIQKLFDYCLKVYPERFFDILYKNEDVFKDDSTISCGFLPGVDFKVLYNLPGVTDNTKTSIWSYLQLIMFTIIGSVRDKTGFGETSNIFDGISEGDLFEKLTETMQNMSEFFGKMSEQMGDMGGEAMGGDEHDAEASSKPSGGDDDDPMREEIPLPPKMPNIKEIHEHLKGLFDGKIGQLAKALASEISGDLSSILGEDAANVTSNQDMIKLLIKNPDKVKNLIKLIGEKIQSKMSTGEINQEEMMKEATEILGKMGSMGGDMSQFKDLFASMGVNLPKNARIDLSKLNRMNDYQKTKERLKKRAMEKQQARMLAIQQATARAEMQSQQKNDHITQQELEQLAKQFDLDLNATGGATESTKTKKKTKK